MSDFWLHKNYLRHFLNIKVPGLNPDRKELTAQGRDDHICLLTSSPQDRWCSQEPTVKVQVSQKRKEGLECITSTQEHKADNMDLEI